MEQFIFNGDDYIACLLPDGKLFVMRKEPCLAFTLKGDSAQSWATNILAADDEGDLYKVEMICAALIEQCRAIAN